MTRSVAVTLFAGVAVVAGVGYFAYIFVSAEDRVRGLCAQLQPGMTLPALRAFAEQHGMRKPNKETGLDFLVETKTFGRFGCMVKMDSGVVRTVAYNFGD